LRFCKKELIPKIKIGSEFS